MSWFVQSTSVVGCNSNKISKNAEFYADFRTVEKVAKQCTHKKLQGNQFDEHE
jgi:hypothetical protein